MKAANTQPKTEIELQYEEAIRKANELFPELQETVEAYKPIKAEVKKYQEFLETYQHIPRAFSTAQVNF
jgi:hypothetical protein